MSESSNEKSPNLLIIINLTLLTTLIIIFVIIIVTFFPGNKPLFIAGSVILAVSQIMPGILSQDYRKWTLNLLKKISLTVILFVLLLILISIVSASPWIKDRIKEIPINYPIIDGPSDRICHVTNPQRGADYGSIVFDEQGEADHTLPRTIISGIITDCYPRTDEDPIRFEIRDGVFLIDTDADGKLGEDDLCENVPTHADSVSGCPITPYLGTVYICGSNTNLYSELIIEQQYEITILPGGEDNGFQITGSIEIQNNQNVANNGVWLRISYNEYEGYIPGGFIDLIECGKLSENVEDVIIEDCLQLLPTLETLDDQYIEENLVSESADFPDEISDVCKIIESLTLQPYAQVDVDLRAVVLARRHDNTDSLYIMQNGILNPIEEISVTGISDVTISPAGNEIIYIGDDGNTMYLYDIDEGIASIVIQNIVLEEFRNLSLTQNRGIVWEANRLLFTLESTDTGLGIYSLPSDSLSFANLGDIVEVLNPSNSDVYLPTSYSDAFPDYFIYEITGNGSRRISTMSEIFTLGPNCYHPSYYSDGLRYLYFCEQNEQILLYQSDLLGRVEELDINISGEPIPITNNGLDPYVVAGPDYDTFTLFLPDENGRYISCFGRRNRDGRVEAQNILPVSDNSFGITSILQISWANG